MPHFRISSLSVQLSRYYLAADEYILYCRLFKFTVKSTLLLQQFFHVLKYLTEVANCPCCQELGYEDVQEMWPYVISSSLIKRTVILNFRPQNPGFRALNIYWTKVQFGPQGLGRRGDIEKERLSLARIYSQLFRPHSVTSVFLFVDYHFHCFLNLHHCLSKQTLCPTADIQICNVTESFLLHFHTDARIHINDLCLCRRIPFLRPHSVVFY
jgi:hypothetical protein